MTFEKGSKNSFRLSHRVAFDFFPFSITSHFVIAVHFVVFSIFRPDSFLNLIFEFFLFYSSIFFCSFSLFYDSLLILILSLKGSVVMKEKGSL